MKKSNEIGLVSGTGNGEVIPARNFTTHTTRRGETLCFYWGGKGGTAWHAWPADMENGRQAHGKNGVGYSTAYGALKALRALNPR